MERPVTARRSSEAPVLLAALLLLVGGANRSGVIRTMIRMMSNEDD
jgi:hypothetical protein